MNITRRKFLAGFTALVAAPAVVRYSGVMRVNALQASPFATVTGLDLSGQPIVYKLWEPTNVNLFMGMPEFKNLSRVTSWDYAKAIAPNQPQQPRLVLDDEAVNRYIAARLRKEEQRRQAWLNDPSWTIYGTINGKEA